MVSNNLGEAYKYLGKYERAEKIYLEGIKVAKEFSIKDSSIEINYANYLLEKGDFEEAYGLLNRLKIIFSASEYVKQRIYLYTYLADYWAIFGNFSEALKCIQIALSSFGIAELNEQKINVLISHAKIYFGLGDINTTYQYLIKADRYAWELKSEPAYTQILIEKGKIHIENEQYFEAAPQ